MYCKCCAIYLVEQQFQLVAPGTKTLWFLIYFYLFFRICMHGDTAFVHVRVRTFDPGTLIDSHVISTRTTAPRPDRGHENVDLRVQSNTEWSCVITKLTTLRLCV